MGIKDIGSGEVASMRGSELQIQSMSWPLSWVQESKTIPVLFFTLAQTIF